MRPHVNNLVVAFARSDDTFAILFLDFLDLSVSVANFFVAFFRNDHVVNAD